MTFCSQGLSQKVRAGEFLGGKLFLSFRDFDGFLGSPKMSYHLKMLTWRAKVI